VFGWQEIVPETVLWAIDSPCNLGMGGWWSTNDMPLTS
jgi:hypothetical protein